MNEYWEITQQRGMDTVAVWQLQAGFALQKLSLAQHTAAVAGLPVAAQTRAAREADLADARQRLYTGFALLGELNVRVPGAIGGLLTEDDDLHGQLDLIFAEDNQQSQAATLRRARLVSGAWADFNASALPPPRR